MANRLYEEQQKMTSSNNIKSQFNNFMQNPMQYLLNQKINIPQEYTNDPHGAVQYLLNNGSMSQDTFNKLRNTAMQMGIRV